MDQAWTDNDQIYLILAILAIPAYHAGINEKDDKSAKKITSDFAEALHQHTPELQHRSITAITQRLPYLDNLSFLAGVWETHNYAQKDQELYNTQPRPSR